MGNKAKRYVTLHGSMASDKEMAEIRAQVLNESDLPPRAGKVRNVAPTSIMRWDRPRYVQYVPHREGISVGAMLGRTRQLARRTGTLHLEAVIKNPIKRRAEGI